MSRAEAASGAKRDEADGMKNKLRGESAAAAAAAAATLCSINKRSVSPSVFSISSVLGTRSTPTAEISHNGICLSVTALS